MRPPIIVFDLDGTLIDTAPDLIDSLNHSLAAERLRAVDRAGFGAHVGHGRPRDDRARLPRSQRRARRRPSIERLYEFFLDHYAANIPGRSRPYPGVLEAIARARERRLSSWRSAPTSPRPLRAA